MKKIVSMICLFFSVSAFAQPSVTEISLPQYVQGVGSANPPDDRKVPFVCRMQVDGLTPNATYRFYSLFGNAPSGNTGVGGYIVVNQTGNFQRVTSATLSVAGRYQTATTDATGSFTTWCVLEPSSDINFAPGTSLYWRIFLNNGNNGAAVVTRITNPNPVTVLGWGTAPNQGTGLRSTAISQYTAKNFVLLYDNADGTGRPVSGSFIESDGTRNLSALNPDVTNEGYAPFYGDNVDGQDKVWGTIIPNNLAGGIRSIAEFSLTDGSKLRACLSADGTFGSASTVNANGGLNAIVLTCTPTGVLPVTLLRFTASAMPENKVLLKWATSLEQHTKYFIVERSFNATTYNRVDSLGAKGIAGNYETNDELHPGVTYYRLKIVDNDGKLSYSNIAIVNGKEPAKLLVSPNPATNKIAISHSPAVAAGSISVYSISGARILSQQVARGAFQTSLDISRLSKGNYYLVYENAGKKETVSFTKM
ncbi:T9SS type A sorting domain-containing protein [Ferruginibacter sp. HRS2-29]|uniref:T9SS type A sorting domain-containing protein n=1 Tax=Ferruginibacter sp. HRS2-29 TaxID=2487334 RepID=UPI0020CBDA71|nr:T9SS type A sorting domain-containing protein [Ferruginibacter sp. HRS2-29]MCP9751971.1 T9SS C-terminal target domain-containing protein [Ferruginibacter sp. HRS2-29]